MTGTLTYFDTPTILTGDDCDRCNQPNAVMTVKLPSGAKLTLCGHHFRQHQSALPDQTEAASAPAS